MNSIRTDLGMNQEFNAKGSSLNYISITKVRMKVHYDHLYIIIFRFRISQICIIETNWELIDLIRSIWSYSQLINC